MSEWEHNRPSALRFSRGDSFGLVIDRVNSDGTPFVLTGYTVEAELLTPSQDVTAVLSVSVGNQLTTPGRVVITALAGDTELWAVGAKTLRVRERNGAYVRTTYPQLIDVIEGYQ